MSSTYSGIILEEFPLMKTNLLSFFKKVFVFSFWFILLGMSELAHGQPLPNIVNLDLKVNVVFNPVDQVYSYAYTIVSGPENLGEIDLLMLDILTEAKLAPTIDPDLVHDGSFQLENGAPTRSVPVGLQSPVGGWISGISVDGMAMWVGSVSTTKVTPGTSLDGFVITSKAPPGKRVFEMTPVLPYGDPLIFPTDCEINPACPDPESFKITGQTIGPVLDEELVRIDGKSQNAIRNAFLSYSNPTTIGTTLAPGVNIFDLVVFLGPTTDPMTFTAELNGVVIMNKFTVFAGSASVVRLDLVTGNNVLILTVEGVRPSGATGMDTDKFTFTLTP